jgi:hypothetical protein
MDLLDITASVLQISEACISVVKALNAIRQKFRDSSLTLCAICTESTVINASLSQIQTIILRDPDRLQSQLTKRPDLSHVFDAALVGCMMLFASLKVEIDKMAIAAEQSTLGKLNWSDKFKVVWKEERMVGLLQQIRGQEIALTLLMQSLQM